MSIRVGLVAALLLTACPAADSCKSKNDCFKGFECINAVCVASDAGSNAAGGTVTAGGSAGGVSAGGMGGGSAGGASAGGAAPVDGESCARPNALVVPSTLTATTIGARNDVSLRCTGFLNPGPDLVYSATVPAGQRLVVSIEPTEPDAGLRFDPSLSIVSGPAANCASTDAGVCLVGRDERGGDTAVWLNEDVFEREVFVIVDSYLTEPDETAGSTFQGAFSLSARFEVPGAGDRCETAEAAPANGTRQSTLTGYGPDYRFSQSTGCAFESGPDRVFAIDVPAGERLTATATPAADAGLDIVVNLVAAPAATCRASPPVCLASADRGVSDEPDTATFINTSTATQSLFVVVGSYFAMPQGADFTLTTTSVPPPPGDTCATATPLATGAPLTGQTLVGYGDDVSSGTGCASGGTGADRFYALTIPGGKQLTVTATPQATLDTVLSLVDAAGNCARPFTCLTGAPSNALGQVDQLFFTNRNMSPLMVFIAVDSRALGSGTFDLLATLADPPAGDFCGIANTLTMDAGVSGTTLGATNDYEDGDRCASGYTGPDTTYALDIPPGQRATLTVTPTSGDGGFNPSLSIVAAPAASCEATPRVCVGAANAAFGSTAPRTATAYNPGSTPLSTFVIVDGASASSGTFTLSATAATPPANDVCTTTTAMLTVTPSTSTQPLTGQTLTGFGRDYDCVSFASGADRVYGAQVTALQRVSLTVTPTPLAPDAGSFDPVLSVIGGPSTRCDSSSRVCLGQVDDAAQGTAETIVFNHTGAAQQVFVAVGSYESAPIDSTFSIVATSQPLLDGEVCEKPIPISVTNTRSGDSLRGLWRDYDLSGATCSSSFGDDAVYAVTFTNSFTITVTPDAMSDVVLNVLDGPAGSCAGATACLASADQGGDGAPEVVSVVNPTGAPRTVFLVVSAFSSGDMTFSVAATIN